MGRFNGGKSAKGYSLIQGAGISGKYVKLSKEKSENAHTLSTNFFLDITKND